MRNFVAKHDFNRASTHKSLKDYTRVSQQELMEEWDEFMDEEELPIKDPKEWESTNTRYW
jgi:hypothetical protein